MTMFRPRHLSVCFVALAAASCGSGASDNAGDPGATVISTSSASPTAENTDVLTRSGHGMIGPVSYSFDDSRLTRAEVELPIPPNFRMRVWAVKLIPTERAELLGQVACRYGASTIDEVCNVEDEAGLALAMLERPIADYRENFTRNGYGEEQLGSTEIAGQVGFVYNTEVDGEPTEYRFVPVAGRTLMLMRQAGPGLGKASKAIGAVVSGLRLGK